MIEKYISKNHFIADAIYEISVFQCISRLNIQVAGSQNGVNFN